MRRIGSWSSGRLHDLLGDIIDIPSLDNFEERVAKWGRSFHFKVDGAVITFGILTDWKGFRDTLAGLAFMTSQDRDILRYGAKEVGEGGKDKKVEATGTPSVPHDRPLPPPELAAIADLERALGNRHIPVLTQVREDSFGLASAGGNVVALCLANQGLEMLPASVGALTNLKVLYFGGNRITQLPVSINKLESLKELDLHKNLLTSLPEEIGKLSALQILKLSSNKITSLPEEIGKLSKLQNLDLHDNKITSLPVSLGNLQTLLYLNLYVNLISSLPDEVNNALNTLKKRGCKITLHFIDRYVPPSKPP